jgi:predicted  nucleic acid-binding Zn-ribbon protein
VTQGSCGQLLAGYGYGLANSLVSYAESRHNMNGNSTLVVNLVSELKAVSSVNQLTFNVFDKIDQLYTATADMKAAGDSMLANKLFIHYLESGYYICTPIPLDTASITSAVTDASAIKANAACFASLDSSATDLLNNTLDRMDYRLNVRQKEVYQTEFTSLMSEYNLLAENATQILTIFNSSEINQSMSNIENYSAAYYQYTSAQNYEAAGQEVANIRGEIENLESSLATVNEAYSGIGAARDSASAAIEKLTILVASTDNSLASERNAVINNFNQLESSISSKISYSSASGFADQYNSIAIQANSVINKQKDLDAGKVGNIFSDFARETSLAVLNTISDPLGVREEEKRTWMSIIPTIVISILDILILAIISLGFFVLVWNRTKDFLKSKVIRTWAIIFVFIVVLLLGLSYALNSLIVASIGPTSYFDFMTHLTPSDSAYIFVEYSSSTDSASISNCASKIESALTASGKTATIVNVVDGVCKDTLYSECLLQVGSTPIINLKYAKTNSTAFYTFYKIESDISGDDSYFDECTFATLVG